LTYRQHAYQDSRLSSSTSKEIKQGIKDIHTQHNTTNKKMMKMFHMSSSIFLGNKTTTTTALPTAAAAAVVTLVLLLVVAPNPACDAFTPKPFVPMSSFLSPDPVNPKTSAISPMLSMANYMSNSNNNGYYNNGGGGGDYYGGYIGGGYNGDTFRSGRNSNGNFNSFNNGNFNNGYYYNDNDMYYNGPFMNRRVVGNDYYRGGGGGRLDGDYDDYYRGPYAPPSSADAAARSRSMQFNSNQVGRYNQYRYDYDNYNDDYTRRNRGAPLMNNRRLGNMMNNNNINNNSYGSNFANGGRGGNGGNGGGLMRYNQGNDYIMDSNSQSFYNLEGKRVRRYDPMWDNGLYNQDALYDSNNNYLSPQQQRQRYNTNGSAGAAGGLRRFDPYFDEGRGYYNPNALYEGQALGTRRYHLDPYYDEDRFGWGGDTGGGRNSRYSREYGYDDALMDQDYRRSSSGYNQRRRPPPSSNVMGSGVGYDDRMERYGRSSGGGGGAGSYGVERRGSSSRVGGGGGRYGDDGYDYYNGGRGGGYGEDYYGPGSARLDERSRYANRPPRIREPFVKNMEDDSNGGKGPRRGGGIGDSRSAEVSRSNGRDRDYAMSGGGGRGSTINGSYNRGGSTVNGSYYPPPRGEANGGMSIDDLKEML
jgi:hypothetical protein